MNSEIVILNETYEVEEQLIVQQYSGRTADLSNDVKEILTVAEAETLDNGDWVTIIDGEVVSTGEFHPAYISIVSE